MDSNELETLSNYRLEQAKENLEEASALANLNKYKGASNRAYYAIFHSIKAILALEEIDFKKHSSVIAYFNKNYISIFFLENWERELAMQDIIEKKVIM